MVVACLDAIAGVLPVDPNLAGGLDNAIAAVLNVHEKCVIKGLEALGGPNQSSTEEEDDEDDLRDEDLLNDTESLLYGVIRLAGGLLTVSGINALSKMTPLMSFCSVYGPAFIPESSKISFTRHATLCLLDDVIRHAPESATFAQANELICRSLLSCIGDQKTLKNTTSTFLQNRDQDELQAAIYGIGIAAEKSAAHYENLCLHSALPVLLNGILANASAFSRVVVENSLSTIARICRAYCALGHANINEDFINNQIIPLWLPLLPPREDSEEAPVIVEWLLERCEMYDSLYGSKFIFDDSTFDKTIPSGHALYVFQDALKMSEMGGDVDYPKALLERISARISLLIGGNGSSLPLAHLNYARSKAI